MAAYQNLAARLIKVGVLILGFGIATGCSSEDFSTGASEDTSQMNSNGPKMVSVHLGRFVTEQPEWLQWEGGRHSVRHVMIKERPWPNETDPSRAFEQRWDSTMATLRERDFKGTADIEQVVVEKREIRPGLRGVLYHRGYSPEELMWHALLQTSRVGVTFQKNSWKGEAKGDLEVVKKAADAYQPKTNEVDTNGGFHIREGVITLPFQEAESLTARYAGNEIELTYDFKTLRESPESSLWERIKDGVLKEAARVVNLSMDTIRDRERTAAGLEGKEEVVEYSENEEQRVTLLWLYPGKVQSGIHPRIEIEMEVPAKALDDTLPVWDHILDSLRLHTATE